MVGWPAKPRVACARRFPAGRGSPSAARDGRQRHRRDAPALEPAHPCRSRLRIDRLHAPDLTGSLLPDMACRKRRRGLLDDAAPRPARARRCLRSGALRPSRPGLARLWLLLSLFEGHHGRARALRLSVEYPNLAHGRPTVDYRAAGYSGNVARNVRIGSGLVRVDAVLQMRRLRFRSVELVRRLRYLWGRLGSVRIGPAAAQ